MPIYRRLGAFSVMLILAGTAAASQPPLRNAQGFLTSSAGQTLYTYDPDETSGKSQCSGPCAAVWPPYVADDGSTPAAEFSVSIRADGTRQWVYQGRPLYLFAGDAKAGDKDGDGVNGTWHIVH